MERNQNEDWITEKDVEPLVDLFSPFKRRKEFITYIIRTVIAACLYYWFWEYTWVRWSLWLYVPLNLFGLFGILFAHKYVLWKLKKLSKKLEEISEGYDEEE